MQESIKNRGGGWLERAGEGGGEGGGGGGGGGGGEGRGGGRGAGGGPLYFNSAAGFRGYSILYSMYLLQKKKKMSLKHFKGL